MDTIASRRHKCEKPSMMTQMINSATQLWLENSKFEKLIRITVKIINDREHRYFDEE